jgi:exodeoxyribonuclease V beta subunit
MKPPVLDALSVPLDGACLVEASAGTGKTFNLTRLFLRLLLEKDVPVESILTVTFTEAATAELRLRIRQKLAEAASFFAGGESDDELLRRLRGAADPETLLQRARRAVRDFDLCSISTIHGFCERMLHENAFESGQAFEQELMPDVSPMIEEVVRDFCALRLFAAEPTTIAAIDVHRNFPGLLELAREAVRRPDAVLICEPEASAPRPTRGRGRATKVGAAEEDSSSRAVLEFYRDLAEYARRELPRRKQARRVFSFDDMLLALAQALEGEGGERLAEKIRLRYRAALIDEFQDTDPVQYRIFQRVFQRPGIPWFLVGDPKQSIYRFRGADVFAYLQAARDVPSRLDLDRNFRSDPSLVEATNLLFERLQRKAAPFVLEGIPFAPAQPRENARDRLRWADRPAPPLVIEFLPASGEQGSRVISKDRARRIIPERMANEIAELLSSGARIEDRPVSASDVAVLTANNDEALEVQAALRQRGLPSVLVTERSVFESEEARALYRVLSAAADPQDAGGLRGALAGELIGLRAEDFARFEHDERAFEPWIERAREWRRLWRERGVLSLVSALLDLRPSTDGPANAARLLALPGGERRLTNLRHLAELAHREESARGLGPEGLLGWFEQKMRDASGGEETELRLESDENAVRVSTVHKAKGLEYPIVFCPYLWDAVREPNKSIFLAYHDPGRGGRPVLDLAAPLVSDKKGNDSGAKQQAEREALAEGMRLVYVALTRARHQCRILCGRIGKSWHRSPLAYLLFRPALGREESMEKIRKWTDADLLRSLEALAASSGGKIAQEEFRSRPAPAAAAAEVAPPALSCRKFDRVLSGSPLTTSYSQMAAGDPSSGERDLDAPAPEAPARPPPAPPPRRARAPTTRRLGHQVGNGNGLVLARRRHQHRRRPHGDADVRHLGRACLVGPIEIRVVVAIGEVRGQHRRDARTEEDSVVAPALVRARLHDPACLARAPETDRQIEVVHETALERLGAVRSAAPPLGVRVGGPGPYGRRVGLLLDQERATRLGRVLAGHVEREHVAGADRARFVRAQPLAARAHLIAPDEGQRPVGRRNRSPGNRPLQRARHLQHRPAPARIVVGSRFLDVRHHHDAFVGPRAPGDLGHQRAARPGMDARFDLDPHRHRARLQPLAQARGDPRACLESEGPGRLVVRDRPPLEDLRRLVWTRVGCRARRGNDAEGAAVLHRFLPQHARAAVAQDDGALDVERVVAGSAGAGADVHETGRDPAGRRRERVDTERDVVDDRVEDRFGNRARGRLDDGHLRAHEFPAVAAVRILLAPHGGPGRRRGASPREAGLHQAGLDVVERGGVPRVDGDTPEAVHESDHLHRPRRIIAAG